MRIAFIGGFREFLPELRTDEERWARALERRGVEVARVEYEAGGWLEAAAAARPDWVLLSKCKGLTPAAIERLRRLPGAPGLAQVLFDLMDFEEPRFRGLPWPRRNRLAWWLPVARRLDVVFHRELGHADRYAAEGVRGVYLDQAADADERPAPSPSEEFRCDVAFFGRFLRPRAEALRRMGDAIRVLVFSEDRAAWTRAGFDVRRAVFGPTLARAVRSASIVYGESFTHDVAGYWSDRVYRVVGHEGFFLTRYTPGLEAFFTNGEHLVWFTREEEIPGLVRRWLADPEGRERVARSGRAHLLAHHTYDHRAAEMLRCLLERRPA